MWLKGRKCQGSHPHYNATFSQYSLFFNSFFKTIYQTQTLVVGEMEQPVWGCILYTWNKVLSSFFNLQSPWSSDFVSFKAKNKLCPWKYHLNVIPASHLTSCYCCVVTDPYMIGYSHGQCSHTVPAGQASLILSVQTFWTEGCLQDTVRSFQQI